MKNSNAANPAEAGVINSRYMNSEADYKKFGVKPNTVEVWEDGLRGSEKPNNSEWEWWYFDAIMDDGTSLIIQFLNPAVILPNRAPAVNFQITTPDGKHHRTILESTPDEDSFGEGKCDVHFGRNSFVGDLKNYTLHVEENDQFGADIRFTNLGTPFRPGTAYFAFGGSASPRNARWRAPCSSTASRSLSAATATTTTSGAASPTWRSSTTGRGRAKA